MGIDWEGLLDCEGAALQDAYDDMVMDAYERELALEARRREEEEYWEKLAEEKRRRGAAQRGDTALPEGGGEAFCELEDALAGAELPFGADEAGEPMPEDTNPMPPPVMRPGTDTEDDMPF